MEFDLIRRYFGQPFKALEEGCRQSVVAGIGDDCASLRLSPGHLLYMSTDTLVEGVHFFHDDPPANVGWKSLACNLSDLAACGADPIGFNLSLSLPFVDEGWLAGFSSGLLQAASQFNCPLVGGDTTSAGANAASTLSITIIGQSPETHRGFHRSLALPGDDVWVSGMPGLARLGMLLEYQARGGLASCCTAAELPQLASLLSEMPTALKESALLSFQQPQPQVRLGVALRSLANACIDLSDGLVGDLSHIALASGLSAVLSAAAIRDRWLQFWPSLSSHPEAESLLAALVAASLQGGDDFQLCWTASSHLHDAVLDLSARPWCIGHMVQGKGVWLSEAGQPPQSLVNNSYNHFKGRAS
ncbi:MAG TPA: thiamine-phosphate kinase [Limnobacter sp.]|nr:thiamine-phosphate kinase [Limnobacter sp.]